MVAIGQTYRSEGRPDAKTLLIAAVLAATAGVLAAAAAYPFQSLSQPKILIGATGGQGALIGGVLYFVVGRLRLCAPRRVALIGAGAALGSIALLHHALYLSLLDDFAARFPDIVATVPDLDPEQRAKVLAAGPKCVFDDYLRREYGYSGAIGGLRHRAMTGRHPIAAVVVVYAIGAVMALVFAVGWAVGRSASPYCAECDEWCVAEVLPGAIPGELAPALGAALGRNDHRAAVTVLSAPIDPARLQKHYAKVTLRRCPDCDLVFADIQRHQVVRRAWAETKVRKCWIVVELRIGPLMAKLLRDASAAGPDGEVVGMTAAESARGAFGLA